MAEMTVAEAIEKLKEVSVFKPGVLLPGIAGRIAALIEQQAAEIERLKAEAQSFGEQVRRGIVGDYQELSVAHEYLKQEIAKKDRMLARSCEKIVDLIRRPIARGEGLCPFSIGLTPDCFIECNNQFTACWLAWLEKEAEEGQ